MNKFVDKELLAIAAVIKTPDLLFEKVNNSWEDDSKRVAALAYTDALYKVQVARELVKMLEIKPGPPPRTIPKI